MSSGLGQRIRNARTAKGLTLRAVARESGISASYLSMLENDHMTNPTLNALEALARALGTTPAALLGAEEDHPA